MISAPSLIQTCHCDAPVFMATPKHAGEIAIHILCSCLQVFLTGNTVQIGSQEAFSLVFYVQLIIGWVLHPRAEWNMCLGLCCTIAQAVISPASLGGNRGRSQLSGEIRTLWNCLCSDQGAAKAAALLQMVTDRWWCGHRRVSGHKWWQRASLHAELTAEESVQC